jgi:nitroreductase
VSSHSFQALEFKEYPGDEMERRAAGFQAKMGRRRSVREFSNRPVPRRLVELAIRTAISAPSGANCQPWHFVAVGRPELKRRIREAAEKEERESYQHRMPEEWLEELAPLGTDWHKPYLETAPWLVVVFAESYRIDPEGTSKRKNYYVQESVGIACGLFIAAIHQMGLATLTHTPSPMGFLRELLERPANERPYMLFPLGYPAEEARVPVLEKKSLDQAATFML